MAKRSRGAVALAERVERQGEIAARLRVGQPLVSKWLSGAATPGASARERLNGAFGIPPGSWDEPPSKGGSNGKASPPASSPPPEDDPAADLRSLAATLRREILDNATLTIAERTRAFAILTSSVERAKRFEGTATVTEAALVASEPWKMLKARILASLEHFPEALRAVVETLGSGS